MTAGSAGRFFAAINKIAISGHYKEVDDEYITEAQIFPQPRGVVSEMAGFNLNVKVFRAFHFLAALEMAFGANNIYDWVTRQD